MNAPVSPIQQSERIQILDVLRGFAIFGILAVNIFGFATPLYMPGYAPPPAPWYDALAKSLMIFFAEDKFYSIFSFLFGLGFSVQMTRLEARGGDIRSFYPRRLWVLLLFGILHAVTLWIGDILRIYALLGFALLAFRKRSDRALLSWAGIFFALAFILQALAGGETNPPAEFDMLGMARAAYHSSSYLDVFVFQFFASLGAFAYMLVTYAPSVMALFLLGLWAGRQKFFEHLPEHRAALTRLMLIGGVAGALGNSLYLWADTPWLASLGITIGAPALAAVYVSGLSLLSIGQGWGAKALLSFAYVGRMALTNYILQSLLCSLLFGGFGFGLYEKVGAAGLLGITILIYLVQIPFSAWWLEHFQFGLLEWLWRSLTYRKFMSIKRIQLQGV
jgi:uncharacterized protein